MVINDGFNRFLWEDHANIMGYNNGIFGETYLMGCIQANLQTCRTFGSMLDDIFCFFLWEFVGFGQGNGVYVPPTNTLKYLKNIS